MPDAMATSRKKELEKQLESFLSHATIEVLRDKLYSEYKASSSFQHPDVYRVSQELDLVLVEEQKKLLAEYLDAFDSNGKK